MSNLPANVSIWADQMQGILDYLNPEDSWYEISIQMMADGSLTYKWELKVATQEITWSIDNPLLTINMSFDRGSCTLTPTGDIPVGPNVLSVKAAIGDGTFAVGSLTIRYPEPLAMDIILPDPPDDPPPPPSPSTGATFVKFDKSTRGTWSTAPNSPVPNAGNTYLQDGGYVAGIGTPKFPSYCTFTFAGATGGKDSSTTSVNGPLSPGSAGRTKQFLYANNPITLLFPITDHLEHTLALYFWDWQAPPTKLRVDIRDADTNALLDSQTITDFGTAGTWAVWTVAGNIKVVITKLSGASPTFVNCVSLGA